MDVETLDLESISDDNPLKLVFKIAKRLLETKAKDSEIFLAKVGLFNELVNYNKVKTMDQRKALTYFLEYLFLIQDNSLSEKFKEIKESAGGVIKMSIDDIREKYLIEEGIEQGIEQGIAQGALDTKIESARNLLKLLDDKTISETIGLDIELIKKLRIENMN